MVALSIFVLLIGVLVAFSREVAKSWGRLHREQQRFAELLVLDRTLDTLLTNMVPFRWKDEDGKPLSFFVGQADRVQFATLHRVNDVSEGALRFVDLSVSENELVAIYQDRPIAEGNDANPNACLSVLAQGIEGVDFQYADRVEEDQVEWLPEWDTERKEIPLAVMVTVRWQDGRTESWLRRTAGSGYHERWGKWQPRNTKLAR